MPAAIPASTVDYSIHLDLLKSPGLQTDSSGVVRLEMAATGKGMGQKSFYKTKNAWSAGPQQVKVSLFLSTDNQFSGDDILLDQRHVNLSFGARKQDLKINFSADGRALASGAYYVMAKIEGPPGVEAGSDLANNQVSQLVNPKGADPILTWTSCALNAVKSAHHRHAGHAGGLWR